MTQIAPDIRRHDDTQCRLGEGALWHPERQQLFWFDILSRRLMSRVDDQLKSWAFDRFASAAGWIDHDTLLVATETDLIRLSLDTNAREVIIPLEADQPHTRSNDGRADHQGGFWIGTMGKQAEPRAGALYRYYKGELRQIRAELSIPNSTCFSTDGTLAYVADTPTQQILRWRLDTNGWPMGEPDLFADLTTDNLFPDGAICDATGHLWVAHWGAGQVARYDPNGREVQTISLPATQPTCPAFGGPNLTTLFVTSATQGMSDPNPDQGQTFAITPTAKGCPEPRVML